jgi:sugar phosphate isomerase/epimerase
MPRLAAFPKAWLDELCVSGAMSLRQWIDLSGRLPVDGLEFFADFLDLRDASRRAEHRRMVEDQGRTIPMLCCSPDFTHPDPTFRRQQVDLEKSRIDMARELGASYCRVLSGQRRSGVSIEDGLAWCIACINECLDHALQAGITLVIENHYKDTYWTHPEFAQRMDVFCQLLERIERLRVNFDPSNTILAGEDPIALLDRIVHRVATMHASDRYLAEGTIEDLRREEDSVGYARRLHHGEIGRGLNDYDAIFSRLAAVGFDGWISIEDGMDGIEQLERSAAFLHQRIARHWPGPR